MSRQKNYLIRNESGEFDHIHIWARSAGEAASHFIETIRSTCGPHQMRKTGKDTVHVWNNELRKKDGNRSSDFIVKFTGDRRDGAEHDEPELLVV